MYPNTLLRASPSATVGMVLFAGIRIIVADAELVVEIFSETGESLVLFKVGHDTEFKWDRGFGPMENFRYKLKGGELLIGRGEMHIVSPYAAGIFHAKGIVNTSGNPQTQSSK